MNPLTFLIVLIGWIFSLCLHEFAHALTAYHGGDYTVKEKGYLTFNPLKYTHPVYSLLLPMLFLIMGGIGLPGGAVYIETWRLRSRQWNSAVALAGPAANLLVAIVIGLLFRFAPTSVDGIWPGLAFLGQVQIIAVVLNLIPIPPLDGYRALAPYLPDNIRESADRFAGIGMWLLILGMWYIPFLGPLFWGATNLIAQALGIPLLLVYFGYSQFMFWR